MPKTAFRTFFGLVGRDVQIRLLLGDPLKLWPPRSSAMPTRAVDQFFTLFEAGRTRAENPSLTDSTRKETIMRVYYDRDADLNLHQGQEGRHRRLWQPGPRPCAQPARTPASRTSPIGLKAGSATAKKVEADGLKVMTVADAAKWADLMMMATPDELQADIYTRRDRPQHPRRRGDRLRPRPQRALRPDRAEEDRSTC